MEPSPKGHSDQTAGYLARLSFSHEYRERLVMVLAGEGAIERVEARVDEIHIFNSKFALDSDLITAGLFTVVDQGLSPRSITEMSSSPLPKLRDLV